MRTTLIDQSRAQPVPGPAVGRAGNWDRWAAYRSQLTIRAADVRVELPNSLTSAPVC